MKKTILIAEDDEAVGNLIQETLQRADWETKWCKDGLEARDFFEKNSTSLVLTDLMMPGLDGFGLLQEVKSVNPDAPVIVITGYGSIERCKEALKKGASDFLCKPFKSEQLKKILEKNFEKYKQREKLDELQELGVETFNLSVKADLEKASAIALRVSANAESAGYGHKRWSMRLCVEEAFRNAVIHGAKENTEALIRVQCQFDPATASIKIEDPGNGFDLNALQDFPFKEDCGGRGVFLIRSMSDEVFWREKGNICEIIFHRNKKGEQI